MECLMREGHGAPQREGSHAAAASAAMSSAPAHYSTYLSYQTQTARVCAFCFSSRRRHPRSTRDWSSDVCSSDLAEGGVLDRYLPTQLSDAEVADLVRAAIAETGATGPAELGAVMRVVQPRAAGRAEGRRLADEVRRQLTAGGG